MRARRPRGLGVLVHEPQARRVRLAQAQAQFRQHGGLLVGDVLSQRLAYRRDQVLDRLRALIACSRNGLVETLQHAFRVAFLAYSALGPAAAGVNRLAHRGPEIDLLGDLVAGLLYHQLLSELAPAAQHRKLALVAIAVHLGLEGVQDPDDLAVVALDPGEDVPHLSVVPKLVTPVTRRGYSSLTPGAHILLTGIQLDPAGLTADAIELAVIAGYIVATRRLARRGRRWSLLATVAFVAGVLALWVAIGSGLAALDDTDETVHMVQHLLLMMVAAPLIVAGRPLTLLCRASRRPVQVRVVRFLRGRTVSCLTSPRLTWPLYIAGMFVYWLVHPVYQATLENPLLHATTHAAFFAIGILYWQPLLGDSAGRRRLSHPVRMLAVLLTMPLELLLGVSLTLLPFPLDPGASLAANRDAGEVFWIVGMLCSGLAVGAISAGWLVQADRQERLAGLAVEGAGSSPTPA